MALAGLALAVTIPLPTGDVARLAIAPTVCQPPDGDNTTVSIGDNFFDPETASVKRGDYVVWTNNGQFDHTATSTADPPRWDSGVLHSGDSFARRFCEVGVHEYRCEIHFFTGRIVVSL